MDEPMSPWLTRAEAASYLRISTATVDRLASSGKITRHRIAGVPAGGNRSVRFRREELDALLTPAV